MADTRLGLATADLDGLTARVLGAWDGFIEVAEGTDPAMPTRLPGWTARELALHLGRWDDSQPLERILDSARAGGTGTMPAGEDAANAAVIAAHTDASWPEILRAMRRSRDGVEEFLVSPAVRELGQKPSMSVVGPLPVLTILNAGSYELAVHALDLGAREATGVLMAGLSALADVTGALLTRQRMTAVVTAQTPTGGWRMIADPTGWDVEIVPAGPVEGVAILATAADVLDVAAGRAFGPTMLAQRRIRMQDLRRFLLLAPIVDAVPGIPGGVPLRAAARLLSGAAGLADKVPSVPRLPGLGRVPGFRR